jgi:hypothetical protein
MVLEFASSPGCDDVEQHDALAAWPAAVDEFVDWLKDRE